MPKFREITGQFVGYVPDGVDPDIMPDRNPIEGRVTFTPIFTGGVIAFPELSPPEFAHPEPISARIVDGFVRVQVGVDDDVSLQPLSLMVTVDDEASQVWSWRAEFTNMRINNGEAEISIPSWSFRVPDGTGPVDLTELVPLKTGGSVDVTKGPRGAGLQTITAVDGQLVFEYTDGEQATIAIPEAVQGPQGEPGPAGADGEQGPEGPQGPAGEIPDLLVSNITDATPTGKNLMLAATEGAARNALGLAAGATAIAGGYSELENGTQTNSRVWSPKNISDYVEERTSTAAAEAKNYADVTDFGAIGDGTADDTAAIQAALDSVFAAGGGEVVVPNNTSGSTYRAGRLYIGANTTFRMFPGVTIKRKGPTYGIVNLLPDFSMGLENTADPYSAPGNIRIVGGTWDGAISTEPYLPGGYNLFYFAACRNIAFEDFTVKDMATNHCLDLNAVIGGRVSNCEFLGYKDATVEKNRDYTEAIQIGGFNETASVANSEGAAGAPSRDIIVTGCRFGPSGTTGTQAWPAAVGNHGAFVPADGVALTGGITVRDCEIEGSTFIGITPYTWNDTTIDGCRFIDCSEGIRASNFTNGKKWDAPNGAWVDAPYRIPCSGLTVVNCIFSNTAKGAITVAGTAQSSIDGSWAAVSRVIISGNQGYKTTGRSTGPFVRLLICSDATIANNVIRSVSSGVAVEACQRVRVIGNAISDTANYGISMSEVNAPSGGVFPPSDYWVSNNVLTSLGTHGIGLNASTRVSAVGNSVNSHATGGVGTGILLSGSSYGVVTSNQVVGSGSGTSVYGINATGSTNIRVTFDNLVEGVNSRILNVNGTGSSYGNISYS